MYRVWHSFSNAGTNRPKFIPQIFPLNKSVLLTRLSHLNYHNPDHNLGESLTNPWKRTLYRKKWPTNLTTSGTKSTILCSSGQIINGTEKRGIADVANVDRGNVRERPSRSRRGRHFETLIGWGRQRWWHPKTITWTRPGHLLSWPRTAITLN